MEETFALGDAFSWFIQERRYPQAALYQTSMDEGAELVTFQGDPEWFYPPLGWTLTWDGAHIASLDNWVKHQMVSWGYFMWDASRLVATGMKDMLELQRNGSQSHPGATSKDTLTQTTD